MDDAESVRVEMPSATESAPAPPPIINQRAQSGLLDALHRSRLEEFRELLSQNINVDHQYEPDESTLLITACWSWDHHEFVSALLEVDANPNVCDKMKRTPLHVAAYRSNDKALRLLLDDKRTDVRAMDSLGATALHYMATPFWELNDTSAHKRCIEMLMSHPHFEVNRPDCIGETALSTAAQQPYDERIQVMLELGRNRLNLDYSHVKNASSLRDIITKRFPKLQRFLPEAARQESPSAEDPHLRLMAALQRRDLDAFRLLLRGGAVDANHWYDDPYYCTCLELACRQNDLEAFVDALIDANADPDTKNVIYGIPVLHQATENGNYKALKVLIYKGHAKLNITNNSKSTALHVVAKKQCTSQEEEQDMQRCLELLLAHKERPAETEALAMWYDAVDKLRQAPIDIDAQDEFGDTALHDAAYYGNEKLVLTLLRRGASIMLRNSDNEPPLASIDANTLDQYLDEQIRSNGLSPLSQHYQIIMRYIFLETSETEDTNHSEMDALCYISRSSDFRPLLRHPVINSFLDLKWFTVRWFFYINLIIYIIFVTLITSYVLLINAHDEEINNCTTTNIKHDVSSNILDAVDQERSSIVLNLECKVTDEDCAENYMRERSLADVTKLEADSLVKRVFGKKEKCVHQHDDPKHVSSEEFLAHCIRIPCVYLLVALVLREIAQCATDWRRYVTAWVNFIEFLMIIVCGIVLSSDWDDSNLKQHISAIAILLTWTELVLMTGRLPILSVQLEMLKKVSYTFLRFMAWYSLLVIAFALSFYTLFRRSREYDPNNDEPFFLHPGLSVLKTIFMMIGELEASDLVFDAVPGTSHVVFVVFVILVAIILLNLLNGLAVYDTQAIKDDAEVLGLVSMVELISYLEMTLLAVGSRCFYKGFYKEILESRIRVFKPNLSKKQIHAVPYTGQVNFLLDSANTKRFSGFRMERDIMATATDIVNEKKQVSDIEQVKRRLTKLEEKMDEMGRIQSVRHEFLTEALESLTRMSREQRDKTESTI